MSQNIVDYCIGLDLGTGSVGWAVVDMNHRLMKRNGKHLENDPTYSIRLHHTSFLDEEDQAT